jgi:hypothetical protein
VLWFAFGTRIQPVGAPFRLPLWAVLLASAVVPLWTIRLEFREEAPEFSLNELVVVVGLWFATPADLMIGQIAGAMISNAGATLLDRRRPVRPSSRSRAPAPRWRPAPGCWCSRC